MFGKKFLVSALAFCALLSGCSSPVKGAAQPESNATATTATTTTTTAPSSSSAAPTTTTTAPTTTTSAAPAPALPFDPTLLWVGADLDQYLSVMLTPQPITRTRLEDPFQGETLRYTNMANAVVDVTLVVEKEAGGPAYQAWRASAIQDGTYDPATCDVTNGFCSGGSPSQKGQPQGPDTVTLMVAGVKSAGTITVRIQLNEAAKPINATRALNQLAVLLRDRLPR